MHGGKRLSPVVQFLHHGLSLHVIAHFDGNHHQFIDMMVQMQVLVSVQRAMCYRKQVSTELKAKERKARCRTSGMGCPICKEPICKECWKEGYDRHA